MMDRIDWAIVPRFGPTRIILFGSRARGGHREDSDHDIMVVVDGDAPAVEKSIHHIVSPPSRPVDVARLPELSDATIRTSAVVREACALLELLWPTTRYPNEHRPTIEEAAEAVTAARRVRAELGFS
jgi:predicted nucleotidyltransferase